MTRSIVHARVRAGLLAAAMMTPVETVAATLQPDTILAWNAYVKATEGRIERELTSPRGFLIMDFLPGGRGGRTATAGGRIAIAEMGSTNDTGRGIAVPDGLVSHWRGSVFLPGITLETLLHRLQHPSERGPHQEDVLALRVLKRDPQQLTLFIRMTRTKVVTVTYDTEHRVDYRTHGPGRASSRSVATRIVEVDGAGTREERQKPAGQDRGFLWRLNSYWRYEQVAGGVIVELESLTLSRGVPMGLRVVVDPIIDRIARESMERTLDNVRRTYGPAATLRRERVS